MHIDRKLSLTTYYGNNAFQHCMRYHSSTSSCYETLAVRGIRFVDRKLSLTTMLRLNPCVLKLFGVLPFWSV